MKFCTTLAILIFFGGGCAAAHPAVSANENVTTGSPGIPQDASRVADRLASCSHFSGEFNGDGSDRDKEVAATMTELHCDTIERDVTAMRKKYAKNRAVQDAFAAAESL